MVAVVALVQNIIHTKSTQGRLRELEQRNAEVLGEIGNLEKKVKDVDDPFVREKMIREQLNLQKPGEVVVGIPESQYSTLSSQTTSGVEKKDINFFERIWESLKEKLK